MKNFLFIVAIILFASCEKDAFNSSPDAALYFSADTLRFDTVFTSTGSVSQFFKIFNNNQEKIRISEIRLMGGSASPFTLNINGTAADRIENLDLAGDDSMYVFVTVTIDPTASNLPFIVQDSIRIAWNGNESFVQLEAYGQNALFLRNARITNDTAWSNQLPVVIMGPLIVDSGVVLHIPAGSRIYFHADARMQVNGSLQASGTATERILFSGDRLDPYYRDLPGSWQGIEFAGSGSNNVLVYADIKNAINGILTRGSGASPEKLILEQCIIDNCSEAGIGANNSSIRADNCLVSNCGNAFYVLLGGQYEMRQCTFASYSTLYVSHRNPSVFLSDAETPGSNTITSMLQAQFTNCIIWGSNGIVNDEMVTDKQGNGFNLTIDHCLFKGQSDPANASLISVIRNNNPAFDSIDVTGNYYDFHITKDPTAPGINYGIPTGLTVDLDGLNRNAGLPDLGCYEKQ